MILNLTEKFLREGTVDNLWAGSTGTVRVVAVNACLTAPEASAGRLLSLLDQLRPPDAGALPDWVYILVRCWERHGVC
ncbi:hypothetical protein FJT64_018948 [Amphibalanus amphitrite]|uniref:Uncharacterized protein n=1 Tax=Amphibalanus amphitrite TaxID=1232801 RepID=A0A6A4WT84_AMPAM|nr:hypothetical protein FJT64_018948 [Amphibalanus amphitrite]